MVQSDAFQREFGITPYLFSVKLEFILLKHAMQGMSGRGEAGATALAGPHITIGLPTFGMEGVVD